VESDTCVACSDRARPRPPAQNQSPGPVPFSPIVVGAAAVGPEAGCVARAVGTCGGRADSGERASPHDPARLRLEAIFGALFELGQLLHKLARRHRRYTRSGDTRSLIRESRFQRQ
jgi:hypothetical protein